MATDNAISTLGKIVEGPYADCTGMDAAAVAGMWLAALPLTADHQEAQSQHELLVRLLEARDVRVLGQVRSVDAREVGQEAGRGKQNCCPSSPCSPLPSALAPSLRLTSMLLGLQPC